MIDTSGNRFEDHLRQTLNAVADTVKEETLQPMADRPQNAEPEVSRKTPWLMTVAAVFVAMVAVVGIVVRRDGGPPVPATSGSWTQMTTSPLSARFDPSSVWTGSEMIIFGGQDRSGTLLDDGAAYNPETNSWRPIASIPVAQPQLDYRFIHSALVGDTVFAVVPSDSRFDWDLMAYDIADDSWQILDRNRFTQLSNDKVIPDSGDATVGGPTAVAAWNDQLVVYGWRSDLGRNGWAFYDPESLTWGTFQTFPGSEEYLLVGSPSIIDDRYMVILADDTLSSRSPGAVIDLEEVSGSVLPFPEQFGEDSWLTVTGSSDGSVVGVAGNSDSVERVAYQVDPTTARLVPAKAPPAGRVDDGSAALVAISEGYVLIGGLDIDHRTGGLKAGSVALVANSDMSVWRQMPEPSIDIDRTGHVVIWTGSQLIVWGGSTAEPGGPVNEGTRPLNDGSVFTPR